MDDLKKEELSVKSFTIKKNNESFISYEDNNENTKTKNQSKEDKNLNEKIVKLFIGNHPLITMKTIQKLIKLNFLNKYVKSELYYNSIIIDHIIHNEPGHIVAEFKDFLISGDINEFLQNYYKIKESKYLLPKIYEYYINCSVIFPNYVILPESQYIYKNIQKKQRVIDVMQEQEDKEENIKKGLIKEEEKVEDVFTTQILDSILNQTDTSGIKQYFGVSNEGNSLGGQLSKIIEGIHYYENNKVSDLKPKFNNYLYKNRQKINLNDSFFKEKNEIDNINGINKLSEIKNDDKKNILNIKNDEENNKDILNNKNELEIEFNIKPSKKSVLILNKNNINNIIQQSNDNKKINGSSLNNLSNFTNSKSGASLINLTFKTKNGTKSKKKDEIKQGKFKGRNCLGNLLQDNNNYLTTTNSNMQLNSGLNTSRSKCNTSRYMNNKKKLDNNSKKAVKPKNKSKKRSVYGSDIIMFNQKVIKKSLINSLLNSNQALEISNKDIKSSNSRGTLNNNKDNLKTSLNIKKSLNSNSKTKHKKNKIILRNINKNNNINNESENLYYKDKNINFFYTKNNKNIVYQRKKNCGISSYYNKNKVSNPIKNIKIGFKTKHYSSNNIFELKSELSNSNISSTFRNKIKNTENLSNFKKVKQESNKKKITHNKIKSSELNSKNIYNDFIKGKNKIIRLKNVENKVMPNSFRKEKTFRNSSDLNQYNSKNKLTTNIINNSNSKIYKDKYIFLDKKIKKKTSEKSIGTKSSLNSPKNRANKRLILKSDLRKKIIKEDNDRPLTFRESLDKNAINSDVIEILTNKINQIKEYIKESDKKSKNSISHIFRKKKVGRKKIFKGNEDLGKNYGLTERYKEKYSTNKLNILNKESPNKDNKNIKVKNNSKNKIDMEKIEKIKIKKEEISNKKRTINKNNKNKIFRNINDINNGNNNFSEINYSMSNHHHNYNKSEIFNNINNNLNINDNINNNTELEKTNHNIILINNNVKIDSLKVFPMKQLNKNNIIVKGIKINGFEKLISKKYSSRNIDILNNITDRIKTKNNGNNINRSNKYINTSNNKNNLTVNKSNASNFFKKV
jgi:hypothetical protein